jgi:methylmalonyl-CoA mutase N-terminal domain/subunit
MFQIGFFIADGISYFLQLIIIGNNITDEIITISFMFVVLITNQRDGCHPGISLQIKHK